MKILATLILLTACFTLTACNNGTKINGHTQKTALKSVRYIKERLSPEKRIEFEVSFFTLRDSIKDNDAFLSAVDGKTPELVIEEGKKLYAERKAQGMEQYAQYSSWEDMIAKFAKEKNDQGKKNTNADPKDKDQGSVLYKL